MENIFKKQLLLRSFLLKLHGRWGGGASLSCSLVPLFVLSQPAVTALPNSVPAALSWQI